MKKILCGILASTILLCTSAISVNAASPDFDVKVSSSKNFYEVSEQADIHIEATNQSNNDFENVNLNAIIPDGLSVIENNSNSVTIASMKSGETVVLDFKVQKLKSENESSEEESNKEDNSKKDESSEQESSEEESSNKEASFEQKLSEENENSRNETSDNVIGIDAPKTDDNNYALFWSMIILCSAIVASVLILKSKKSKKVISLVLCAGLLSSLVALQQQINVKAVDENEYDVLFYGNDLDLTFGDDQFSIETELKAGYTKAYKSTIYESLANEFYDAVLPKNGEKSLNISDNELPVQSVNVAYESENGTGNVYINDISSFSYMKSVDGALSKPIDIIMIGDTVNQADITFSYDESMLGDVSEENIGICWYDEENNILALLDNTEIDTVNNTISVHTEHFSKYIVVNTVKWYDTWAQEQLVVRDGVSTPYYNVIFALDNSGSMYGDRLRLCKEATKEFINNLKDGDKVSVMTFSSSASVIIRNEELDVSSRTNINSKIDNIRDLDMTNYQAGLYTALSLIIEAEEQADEELSTNPNAVARQNLVVFISDGEPTTNYNSDTLNQLKELANNSKTRMVTLGLGYDVNERYLKEMAQAGNGEYIFISDASKIESVFNTVNDWFVGSTKDTDGDGIPDIVETTGMRTQYGYFIKTDPNNPDSDGDGINDGEEMGNFIYQDNGKSYFEISSDPTIPTTISNEVKLNIISSVSIVKPNIKNCQSVDDIINKANQYTVDVSAELVEREIASDWLSETKYAAAKYYIDISPNDQHSVQTSNGNVDLGANAIYDNQSSKLSHTFTCVNGGVLNCGHDHSVNIKVAYFTEDGQVQVYNENVEVSQSNLDERIKEFVKNEYMTYAGSIQSVDSSIKESLTKYLIAPINDEIQKNNDKIKAEREKLANSYQNIFTLGAFSLSGKELKVLKKDFATMILDKQLEKMHSDDNIINYKKVAADPKKLVKEIVRCIGNSNNGQIEFKSNGKTYIYDYAATYAGMAQGGLELGKIIDKKTGREAVSAVVITTYNTKQLENDLKKLCEFVQKMIAQTYINCLNDAVKDITGCNINELKEKIVNSKFKGAIQKVSEKFGADYKVIYDKIAKTVKKYTTDKINVLPSVDFEKFSRNECIDLMKQINKLNGNIESINTLLDDIKEYYNNKYIKKLTSE